MMSIVFTRVVETGSFTRAATKLGLPNSSVGAKVKRLEEQLGVRLLQRTTRKLSLTDAGRLHYERAVEAFASLEETENVLADTRSNPRGRVRLLAPMEHRLTGAIVRSFLAA
jgi:DNA-binding transcriptional LysR family regulator